MNVGSAPSTSRSRIKLLLKNGMFARLFFDNSGFTHKLQAVSSIEENISNRKAIPLAFLG